MKMEFGHRLGYNTQFIPPFGVVGFAYWKMRKEIFQMDIENCFSLTKTFEVQGTRTEDSLRIISGLKNSLMSNPKGRLLFKSRNCWVQTQIGDL